MLSRPTGPFVAGHPAGGLLSVRFVCGGAPAWHSVGKIQNPFHWMDRMPAPAPGISQGLAALAKFGGGLALIVGLLTQLTCFVIISTMVPTLATVHLPAGNPSAANGGASFESVVFFALVALALLVSGPGGLSLKVRFFGH